MIEEFALYLIEKDFHLSEHKGLLGVQWLVGCRPVPSPSGSSDGFLPPEFGALLAFALSSACTSNGLWLETVSDRFTNHF